MTDRVNTADLTTEELATALIRFIDLYGDDVSPEDVPNQDDYMIQCFEGAVQSVIDERA